MTLFPARFKSGAWDLTRAPWSARRAEWTRPDDYAPTQALAADARDEAIRGIVYESVRDPERGLCTAVLDPAALVDADPLPKAQSWFLTVRAQSVIWQREGPTSFAFDFRAFDA